MFICQCISSWQSFQSSFSIILLSCWESSQVKAGARSDDYYGHQTSGPGWPNWSGTYSWGGSVGWIRKIQRSCNQSWLESIEIFQDKNRWWRKKKIKKENDPESISKESAQSYEYQQSLVKISYFFRHKWINIDNKAEFEEFDKKNVKNNNFPEEIRSENNSLP